MERYTFPRPGKLSIRAAAPSEVGWAEDLYASPETDFDQRHHLEHRTFSRIDNDAARTLEKMNAPVIPELTTAETSAWSLFIMSLLHRTPANLAASKAAGRRIWARAVTRASGRYEEMREPHDPETFDAWKDSLTEEDAERSYLRVLPDVMANFRIGRVITNLIWLRVDLTPDCPDLLLSDDPLARTGSFVSDNAHFAMPLSPRRMLIAARHQRTLDTFASMPIRETSTALNRWVVEGARHFVAARDRSQTRFIANRFGTDPKPPLASDVE